jgi:hypothetical protein
MSTTDRTGAATVVSFTVLRALASTVIRVILQRPTIGVHDLKNTGQETGVTHRDGTMPRLGLVVPPRKTFIHHSFSETYTCDHRKVRLFECEDPAQKPIVPQQRWTSFYDKACTG